ncbi:MAG: DUF4215 domain-containing protein [Myxococcales bacterium]|nr:DUF4215 domain-containing protein [Myxococcales bacterium]
MRSLSLSLPVCAALAGGCLANQPLYVAPTTGTEGSSSSGDASDTTSEGSTSGADVTSGSASATSTTGADTSTTAPVTTGESSTGAVDTGSDPFCGDGAVDPGEECDDGNDIDEDLCTNKCTIPACGDQIVQGDEECDDGDANGVGGICTLMCKYNVCGDGVPGLDEECDDGNNKGGDGCSASCMQEKCGNMIVDPGESCDDGNNIDTDACTSLCVPPPEIGEFFVAGQAPTIGPGGEWLGGNECDGVTIGFAGDFDMESELIANISGLCVGVKLEPKGNGIFRLAQSGAAYNAMDMLGGLAQVPVPFSTQCQDPGTLLWAVGGYETLEGISELGLQCAEILVKPVMGMYKLFPQPPVMEMPVGMPKGMLINPPANCNAFPGTLPAAFSVEGGELVLGLTLDCVDPDLIP